MTNTFTPAETAACCHLIELALNEDLGPRAMWDADVTTDWFVDPVQGTPTLVARTPGVLAGLPAAALVFARLDAQARFTTHRADGAKLNAGDRIATIAGWMTGILVAERTALNFIQYLSGIATLTRQYVDAVAGLPVTILDTRKTLPGWRLLAKYAVRQGGGHNHRMGLFDMALVKDNHWASMPAHRTIGKWVGIFRAEHPGMPIEIEVDNLAMLDETLGENPPDIVLLDNMPLVQMREAVARRNASAPQVLLEASGGVTLQTVRGIAETGVDRISVGALTHSAPALDIALDYETSHH